MRGEILGLERRRRWSDDEKLAIVRSIGVDGLTVTQVAQRYDLKRQQLYAWRHDLKRRGLCHQPPVPCFYLLVFWKLICAISKRAISRALPKTIGLKLFCAMGAACASSVM